ncbi:TPA: RusA family crossover junction endodeoxyribonuclease [Legionella pneumophila]
MDILRFQLPYPPSINHYYKRTPKGLALSKKGIQYRHDAFYLLHKHRNHCKDKRLAVTINLFPPDKRRRDIDNILKCLLDSMQHAGVYDDDNQIDMLTIIRRHIVKDGSVAVWISECSSSE